VTGIPTDGTYDHLLILASVRSEILSSVKFDQIQMRVNGISSNVYTDTLLYAQTATVVSSRNTARSDFTGAAWPSSEMLADTFGCVRIWIPHYANSANFKQVLMSSAGATVTSDDDWRIVVSAGLYAQTTAISSVEIKSGYAADHAEFSTFTLYGVTGA